MTAMPQAAPVSNTPELTVSELSAALKRTVEDRFGYVRVRGEISNYRGPHSSGHAYFCLKDQGARLDAVVWKTTLQRLKTKPEEGLEIIATGRVTTFPGKSSYQIVIDAIEPAGIGALMALLDERRRRLAAEGLFDQARKRAIPYLPDVIGVVTSPTGAVIRDIVHRIRDRFPRRVIVWPVRVQGETSAAEVGAAIRGFNALHASFPRPDVLIVARGGGSLEDLLRLQRGAGRSRHCGRADPAHFGDRARDRHDTDRLRRRSTRADADRRGGKVRPSSCRADGKPWQCRRPPRRREPPDH